MILTLNEKYDVTPEWFEAQVRDALEVGSPEVVEKLTLPRLCFRRFLSMTLPGDGIR